MTVSSIKKRLVSIGEQRNFCQAKSSVIGWIDWSFSRETRWTKPSFHAQREISWTKRFSHAQHETDWTVHHS